MSPAPEAIAALLESGERALAGEALDAALIARHDSGDARALCDLHMLAAQYWSGAADKVGFHRTHAYVYALEGGFEAEAESLHAALAADGRI